MFKALKKIWGEGNLKDPPVQINDEKMQAYNQSIAKAKSLIIWDGMYLGKIDNLLKSVEICTLAVKQNGLALQHVPQMLITQDMTFQAIASNPQASEFVPFQLFTTELYDYTRKCYKARVERDGLFLEKIPAQFKTKEMFTIAVMQTGLALQFVPKQLRSIEICAIAYRNDPECVENIPEFIRNEILSFHHRM